MTHALRLLAAIVVLLATASSQAAERLEVIVFPGGFNWPLWVAEADGGFVAEGLAVNVTATPNSVFQMRGLAEGRFDIALTNVDNVVAYDEGQGEVALEPRPDFFVFMGAQSGALRLVARPGVASVAALRGKRVAVDAAATGYSIVLRKLLQQAGLREGDYEVQALGGTATRAQALLEGRTDATILSSPLEVLPESQGYPRLANATDAIGPYAAVSGAARRSWAAAHEGTLVAFIRAYARAVDWLRDVQHRDAAIAIYRRNVPQASEAAARAAWDALLGGGEGFVAHARLERAGVETVLRLRAEASAPGTRLGGVERYVDERYYTQAIP